MRYAKYIAIAMIVAGLVMLQQHYINKLHKENEALTATKTALLDSVGVYRTKMGTQAAEIGELRLTMDDMKKYRAEDMKLIKSLNTKGRDLERLTSVRTVTHDTIYSVLRDSVIHRDTIVIPVHAIDIDKRWYSLHGFINGDTLAGTLTTRSELKVVETVKYKRFLGFLWKTNKVKNRKVDVTSLNPNEVIENIEFIVIEE